MKHTPGPWSYDNILRILKRAQDKWGDHSDDDANAHLIAAAPELLSACKNMLKVFGNPNSSADQEVDSMTMARQAILKAEGKGRI